MRYVGLALADSHQGQYAEAAKLYPEITEMGLTSRDKVDYQLVFPHGFLVGSD